MHLWRNAIRLKRQPFILAPRATFLGLGKPLRLYMLHLPLLMGNQMGNRCKGLFIQMLKGLGGKEIRQEATRLITNMRRQV